MDVNPVSSQGAADLDFTIFEGNRCGVNVLLGTRRMGTLSMVTFRPSNNGFNKPIPCNTADIRRQGDQITLAWRTENESVAASLELCRQSDGSGVVGNLTASGRGRAVVRLVWELPPEESGFPFVPAFMYDHNIGGDSPWATYPQLDDGSNGGWAKPWVAKEWFVRADRSSHGLTAMIADDTAYALGGRDVCRYADGKVAEKNGLGISSSREGASSRLSFSLGFANIPYTYSPVSGRNFFSRPEGYVDLDRGEVSSPFFLFAFACSHRQEAIGRLLRKSYAVFQDERALAGKPDKAVTAIADALVTYGYCEKARNFHNVISTDGPRDAQDQFFSSGWAGGSQVAFPLLQAGHLLNREEWLACARTVLCNLAENGINSLSSLFYENYDLTNNKWSTRGWWYDALEKPGHSGYVNGQVCHYLLQGYLVEQQHGVEQTTWLNAGKRVLDHVIDVQADAGNFGYTYNESDGAILDHDGFSGAWFVPAVASLYRITGEMKYLDSAKRAMDFYRAYVEAFCLYGGPHDVFKSPDEEGVLAWIRASHILHEVTRDERFLKDLLMGLEYEFSWKFAYNVVNEYEPLKSLNWRSVGGSVTSVNNPHIHPMGSAVLSSIRYVIKETGDEYLKSRMTDTLNWTLNAYVRPDNQYGWGEPGMINERFCHTDALLLERFPDGRPASTWFCGHSWASGTVLEGLLGIMEV